MKSSITWKIGGEAGFGIMSSGIMLARTFSRAGYHVFTINEYPSLIRGGHNVITARIATKAFHSMTRDVHILIALNAETVSLHKDTVSDGALIVYDPADHEWQAGDFKKPVTLMSIPLREMVRSKNADPVMRNTVTLGITVALLGAPFELLKKVITDQFGRKGTEVVDQNVGFAQAGYDFVMEKYKNETSMHLDKGTITEEQLVLNGSEALGIGAVRAGLKFAAVYPMTPINSVISFLADHAKQLGVVYKQPEDEIAGINMAIGASLGGVRSMVATSGGGFALQVEGVSLAGMLEVPVVIDMGMRVGPATGMPTWTEQGELQFVIHAGHGEFAKVVFAPADAEEAYAMTIEAFHLADKYQMPAFVLTDKYINESQWCVPAAKFKGKVTIDRGKMMKAESVSAEGVFKRFDMNTDDGVSPRSIPGMKFGQYIANSYEHNEFGYVTELPEDRTNMAAKRIKKIAALEKEVKPPIRYGPEAADVTFVTWGSTRGPVLEALETNKYSINGKSTNLVHFGWMFPFPVAAATDMLKNAKRIIDVEGNATAQLASLIREHTGIVITEKLLKWSGRPIEPEEVVERVKS
jgi:2-oxoglutarate ferredoxin oxidoreductase subunit alpha